MSPLHKISSIRPRTPSCHIRLAQPHEASTLALIGASSFIDDPLDAYLYPNRYQNQKEYALVYQKQIEEAKRHGLSWVIVAETPGQVLIGYAIWTRKAKNDSQAVSSLHMAGLETHNDSKSLSKRFTQHLRPIDASKLLRTRRPSASRVQHINVCESSATDYWRLNEVAVLPRYQF